MMGIGFPELMIILVIIMIIFGAGKLPEIGNAFGKSIKNFKSSMKEAEEESADSSTDTASANNAETSATPNPDAAKKEEEMIDEAAAEIKENRIGTIRTAHDGLVQQGDVFTDSMKRTPGGRGRDHGVSRDVF